MNETLLLLCARSVFSQKRFPCMCRVATPRPGDAVHARTLAPEHPAGDHASKSAQTKAAVSRTGHVSSAAKDDTEGARCFGSTPPKPYPDNTADPPQSWRFPNPYGPEAPTPGYSSKRVFPRETPGRRSPPSLVPSPSSAPIKSAGSLTKQALNVSRHARVASPAEALKNRLAGGWSILCVFPCFEDKYRRKARLRVYTPRSTKETSLGASASAFSPRTNTASQSASEPRREDASAWRRRTNSPQCAAEANATPGSRNTRCLLNFFRASSLVVDFRSTTTSLGSNGSIEPFDPRDVVVDLKSTTSEEARKKFSRHLVFRLPGVAFASAAHCGEFVRRLHADASSRRGSDADCDAVFVRGENALADAPRDVSFVDLGVYTRNRAFRLYLSSKHGKTHRMLQPPASRFFRASAGEATRACLETFKACLVSEPADLIGADEGEGTSDGGERRPGVSRGKTRLLEYPGVGASGPYGFGKRHDCGGSAVLSGYGLGGVEPKQRAPSVSSFAADETCPVRLTAAFVCADFDAWSPAGCSGASVRAWTASPGLGVATLHMQGNRFCENTERAHKSNNVSFTVDFREGAYYQRCHDPDCRGFRGCFRPLPDALLAEAVAFCQLARGANGGDAARKEDNVAGARGRWSPPRIGSDDGDDAFFLAAAKAASPSRPRESGWTPPRFGDEEDDEAFWNRAAALACER